MYIHVLEMERKGEGEGHSKCYIFFGIGILGPEDFIDIRNAIQTVKDKWFNIGLELNIPFQILYAIRRKYNGNAAHCLSEMLKKWLISTSPPPTWSGLLQALSSEPVGERRLVEEIRRQYCHEDGEQATGPAPGEVWRNNSVEG